MEMPGGILVHHPTREMKLLMPLDVEALKKNHVKPLFYTQFTSGVENCRKKEKGEIFWKKRKKGKRFWEPGKS